MGSVKLIAAGVCLSLVLAAAWWLYHKGREDERAAALARSIELMRERNLTDDEINRLSDGDLCTALGGRWLQDDKRCE